MGLDFWSGGLKSKSLKVLYVDSIDAGSDFPVAHDEARVSDWYLDPFHAFRSCVRLNWVILHFVGFAAFLGPAVGSLVVLPSYHYRPLLGTL